MSAEEVDRTLASLTLSEDDGVAAVNDAASEGSSDSDRTIRPTPRRTQSAINLRTMASDDVFSASAPYKNPERQIRLFEETEAKPRSDRGSEITKANAQGQLPPDAAIFAANLYDHITEFKLEKALHDIFDIFGKNYVNVKRDRSGHPYAIIQFETVDAADSAIRGAQKTILAGREIRLEKAKVDRAVIITRFNGSIPVTEHEAREHLERFGDIDLIASTTFIPGRPASLPQGQYVRYKYWLDCRDALRMFHDFTSEYRLQLATGLEPRQHVLLDSGTSVLTGIGHARSNVDIKSVFVGNLPGDVTKEEIVDIFEQFGQVDEVNVVRKPYPGFMNVFAFVEYATAYEAAAALQGDVVLRGQKARIEPKEYSARRKNRLYLAEADRSMAPLPPMPPAPRPSFVSPVRRIEPASEVRSPLRISPSVNAALQERLAQNNMANNAMSGNLGNRAPAIYTPPHARRGNIAFANERFTPESYAGDTPGDRGFDDSPLGDRGPKNPYRG